MLIEKPNFFVFTGGPGAGKTTLIEHLRAQGELCIDETARAVIREHAAAAGPGAPRIGPREMFEACVRRDLATFDALAGETRTVFFDRGVIDAYGGAKVEGLVLPASLAEAARERRYNPCVFTFPPWLEIYETDAERIQDFAEATRVYGVVLEILGDLNYRPVELPRASVSERAAFVRDVVRQVSTKARSST